MNDGRERLQALQAALDARGVKDVKFFFSMTDEKPLSEVAADVADALQAIVDGDVTPLDLATVDDDTTQQ